MIKIKKIIENIKIKQYIKREEKRDGSALHMVLYAKLLKDFDCIQHNPKSKDITIKNSIINICKDMTEILKKKGYKHPYKMYLSPGVAFQSTLNGDNTQKYLDNNSDLFTYYIGPTSGIYEHNDNGSIVLYSERKHKEIEASVRIDGLKCNVWDKSLDDIMKLSCKNNLQNNYNWNEIL